MIIVIIQQSTSDFLVQTNYSKYDYCGNILLKQNSLNNCALIASKQWSCLIMFNNTRNIKNNQSKNNNINDNDNDQFSLKNNNGQLPAIIMNCGQKRWMFCCPIWTIIDCIQKDIDQYCYPKNNEENNTKRNHYKLMIEEDLKEISKLDCPDYEYNSSNCKNKFEFINNIGILDYANNISTNGKCF